MTVQDVTSLISHTGNGATTEWPYDFIIPDADHARVGLFDIPTGVLVPLDINDYNITGIGAPEGGSVTYPISGTPINNTKRVVIWREVPYTQDTDLTDQLPYYPTVLEAQLDRIVMQIQQLKEESDRGFKVTPGSTATPDELIEQLFDSVNQADAAADTATIQAGIATTKAGEAADSAAAALASENAVALAAVPVGRIVMRFGAVDPGYIAWGEGGTFDRAAYPDLAAWLDVNGASLGLDAGQIAAGTIPDWRDYVPRTAGGALGPAVGAKQEDAMQRITGTIENSRGALIGSGAFSVADEPNVNYSGSTPATEKTVSFNSGNSPGARVSDDETRVKSFGVRWQIKAYGALVNQGMADLVAIEQAVQEVRDGALRKDVDQSAGYGVPEKVTILKNTLQAWEHAATVDFTNVVVATVTGLGEFKDIRFKADLRGWGTTATVMMQFGMSNDTWIDGATDYRLLSMYSQTAVATVSVGSGDDLGLELVNQAADTEIMGQAFGHILEFNVVARSSFRYSVGYERSTAGVNAETSGFCTIANAHDRLRLIAKLGVFSGRLIVEGIR